MSTLLGPAVIDLKSVTLSDSEIETLKHPYVGGVILFSRNFQSVVQLCALTSHINAIRPDILICVDQEGGRVQRFKEGFTRLPALQKLGSIYSNAPEDAKILTKECGWLMASELRAVGVDLSFAPVVDADDSFSDVIGDRSFSSDVEVVSVMAHCFIEGMAEAGMGSTLKHFPGHGGVKADSHIAKPIDDRTYEELAKSDLVPFFRCLPFASAVMPAHIRFPNITEKSVGFSDVWLKQILRKKLGFDGVVFSDDLTMHGASLAGSYADRAKQAIEGGCDGILICNAPEGANEVLTFLSNEKFEKTGKLESLKSKGEPPASLNALQSTQRWINASKEINRLST